MLLAKSLQPSHILRTKQMKLTIGDRTFATKVEAKKHSTAVLLKYKGRRVDVLAEDYAFVEALWKRSPSWVEGCTSFEVGQKFNGIGVSAISGDGVSIDWSVKSAVSGRHVNSLSQLTQALRTAIRSQILAFRGRGIAHCELCRSTKQIEVDHVVTFKKLMYEYLELWGDDRPKEFIYSHAGWLFKEQDEEFRKGWTDHHRVHCRLRLLCSACHLNVTIEARQSGSEGETSQEVEEAEELPRD